MNVQADARVDELFVDDDHEPLELRSRYHLERIRQSISNFATVSEALRILGAVVILASMSVFLLQGWNDGNDIRRYLLLLAQTGLLAGGGFAVSYGLKENKGARVFFGLALVSIPANFTILGALLYSVMQWDVGLATYPAFATWHIGDLGATAVTLAGAMLALIPLALLGFAIMARRSVKSLTLHFLLLNSLLLLPIRGSALVGVAALAATLYALYWVGRLAARDASLKTPEGKFALATLFIPTGIILFRSMYFYQVDSLLIAMLSLAIFTILRHISLTPDRHPKVAFATDIVALAVAMTAALALTSAIQPYISIQLLAPALAVCFAALALDVARRTANRGIAITTAALVSLLTCASFAANVVVYNTLLSAMLCVLAGAVLVLFGFGFRNRLALYSGYATAATGLVFGFGDLIELISHSGWVELAIFGASAIAIGSVLDRHGASLRLRLGKHFAGFSGRWRRETQPSVGDGSLRSSQ